MRKVMIMSRLIEPLPQLTPRQEDILRFVFKYFKESLSYPTKSQICRYFNAKSNNTAALVNPLFKKGFLRKLPERGAYEFTEQGVEKIRRMGIRIPKRILEDDGPVENIDIAI
jgi:Mn-dependent DtxR family transcriptional regulator